MQLSTDSTWSTCTFPDRRLAVQCPQVPEASELRTKPLFQLRGLAWGVLLSTIFWASFIAAGWELWSWWR